LKKAEFRQLSKHLRIGPIAERHEAIDEGRLFLVAKQIRQTSKVEAPRSAWLFGLAAWAVPGLGHLLQRRWARALLLGGAVWGMFLTGLWLGGHLFRVTSSDQGLSALLQLLPMTANVGAGLLYIFCWLTNTGFADHAQMVTYEYGNMFLLVAGLLNYLAMLDAFDIAAGRKQ
jgi:hypothetical protein